MPKEQLEDISCYSKLIGFIHSHIPFEIAIACVGVVTDQKLLVLQLPMRPEISTKMEPSLEQCTLHVSFVDWSIILVANQ